ncbi:MAG TPA: hypothetical protein VIV63_05590, partial [Steroidobacteraceae bacterium]
MNFNKVWRLALLPALASFTLLGMWTTASAEAKVAPEFLKIFADWKAASDAHDINKIMSVFDKSVVLSFQ